MDNLGEYDEDSMFTENSDWQSEEKPQINSIRNQETCDLRELLSSWNLAMLFDYFIAEEITVEILKMIDLSQVQRLMKGYALGIQFTFELKWKEWKLSLQMPSNKVASPSPMPSLPPPTMTPKTSIPSLSPYDKETSPICLKEILNNSFNGAALTKYYQIFQKFDEKHRNLLIRTIARYFDEKGVHMSLSTSYRLEREIIERFPTEKLVFYRTDKRGRIYSKYTNIKTSFNSTFDKCIEGPPKPQSQHAGDLHI